MAKKYERDAISPSEFALWEPKADLERGFNIATWFMGSTRSTNASVDRGPLRPVIADQLLILGF